VTASRDRDIGWSGFPVDDLVGAAHSLKTFEHRWGGAHSVRNAFRSTKLFALRDLDERDNSIFGRIKKNFATNSQPALLYGRRGIMSRIA
jgi:hypothetical protein